jgi:hypothetical protein
MSEYNPLLTRSTLVFLCIVLLAATPVHAFTAESLDITIDKSGDATAVFRFTLEGLIENAIPQSMLEEQLVNGLAGGSEPPTLVSMDRSSATLVLKKFANTYDSAQGTDYQTSSMDFKKAEIALQSSAVSSVITADFSPARATLTFPDKYARSFSNVDSLPSITHTVIDPAKAATAASTSTGGGILNVTATPAGAEIWIDETFMGNAPATLTGIATGPHTLEFRKDGYVSVSKKVTATEGKIIHITVFLATAAPTTEPSASPAGFLMAIAGIALAGYAILFSSRRQ